MACDLLFPDCRNQLEGRENVQKRGGKIEVFFLAEETL
jgi:hypothetical protein